MALILFAGYLKNAEVAVAALSVWYAFILVAYKFDLSPFIFSERNEA